MDLGVTGVMLPELDFDEQIELCRALDLRYYQYRPRIIPAEQRDKPYSNWGNHRFDLTPARLLAEGKQLTARLRAAGLEPWGTVPALQIDAPDETIRLDIEGAAAAEAKCVRCNPSGYPKGIFNYAEMLERVVQRYRHIVQTISRPLGIKLIIETHSSSLASGPALVWNICKNFEPRDVGVIFDIANFHIEGAIRPMFAASILKDYIDCIHIGGTKYTFDERDSYGCAKPKRQFCRMEDAQTSVPDWMAALKACGFNGAVIIEDYEADIAGRERLTRSAKLLQRILAAI